MRVVNRGSGAAVLLLVAIASTPANGQATSRPAEARGPDADGWYPVDPAERMLRVAVTRHGRSGVFLLDTAATANLVDAGAFAELPTRSTVTGTSSRAAGVKYTLCDPPDMTVGPFDLSRGGPVARVDLSAAMPAGQPPLLGVLGLPCLGRMIVRADFEHRRFRLLPAATPADADWGTAVPVYRGSDGLPRVHVKAGGRDVAAVLDTGADSDGCLADDVFDGLKRFPAFPGTRLLTAGGVSATRESLKRLPTLELVGGDASVTFAGVTLSRGGAQNRIGWGLLARNATVTIDVPGKRMWVRPAAPAATPK